MGTQALLTAILATALAMSIALGAVYFIRAERLLRQIRNRFPVEWHRAGRPTFISFAIAGRGYFRPASASNYFRFRAYRSLNDPELVTRAESVRGVRSLLTGWCIVLVVSGAILALIT